LYSGLPNVYYVTVPVRKYNSEKVTLFVQNGAMTDQIKFAHFTFGDYNP